MEIFQYNSIEETNWKYKVPPSVTAFLYGLLLEVVAIFGKDCFDCDSSVSIPNLPDVFLFSETSGFQQALTNIAAKMGLTDVQEFIASCPDTICDGEMIEYTTMLDYMDDCLIYALVKTYQRLEVHNGFSAVCAHLYYSFCYNHSCLNEGEDTTITEESVIIKSFLANMVHELEQKHFELIDCVTNGTSFYDRYC